MPQCSKAATRSVSRFDDSLQSKSALLLRHGVVLPAALESEMRTLDDSAPAVSAARFWVLREEQRTLLGFASVEAAARQNPIQSKRYQAGTKRYQVGTNGIGCAAMLGSAFAQLWSYPRIHPT